MPLHNEEADRLIDVATGEHRKEGGLQHHTGNPHSRQHHQVHKGDLQNGAGSRITSGAVGIVLRPVAHAEQGSHGIDQQHAQTQVEGFAAQAHGMEQGRMDGDQEQAAQQDEGVAQKHHTLGTLVSQLQVACAHLLAHQHGGCIGEACKEADDQAFQGAEHSRCGDGFLCLAAQDDIDDHVAYADEDLIAEDGEALLNIYKWYIENTAITFFDKKIMHILHICTKLYLIYSFFITLIRIKYDTVT